MSLTQNDLDRIGTLIDKCFSEQNTSWVETLDKRFDDFRTEFLTDLMEVFPTKDEMHVCVENAKTELRDDFRTRMTAVQDALVGFQHELEYDVPPMSLTEFRKHDEMITQIGERVSILEGKDQKQ